MHNSSAYTKACTYANIIHTRERLLCQRADVKGKSKVSETCVFVCVFSV